MRRCTTSCRANLPHAWTRPPSYDECMRHRTYRWFALAALMTYIAVAACDGASDATTRARDLERRILAPCCRRQTLEDHESDIARLLRAEIQRRVTAGETSTVIEEDLVRRYGQDIRAMPPGHDPRTVLGIAVGTVIGAAAAVLVWLFAKRRRDARPEPCASAEPLDDLDEQRLDDELLDVV